MKEALPKGLRCSSEAGNLVMECCMEFLRMVSDEVAYVYTYIHSYTFESTQRQAPDIIWNVAHRSYRIHCMNAHVVTCSQATQLSTKDGKSTIGPDHIYRSIETLGFKDEWKNKLDNALAVRI